MYPVSLVPTTGIGLMNVVGQPTRVYDVLKPIIQTKEEGKVVEEGLNPAAMRRGSGSADRAKIRSGDTEESLKEYAKHLLDTLEGDQTKSNGTHPIPHSPGRIVPRPRILSPSSPLLDRPITPTKSDKLTIPGTVSRGFRSRKGSFIAGDDELVDENDEGCGEAVEILSRHSHKCESGLR
jgi:hypothetical protein